MGNSKLIGGVAVIEREDGRHLLIKQSHLKPNGGKWRHPGGRFEEGETPAQGVLREVREEVGLEVRLKSEEPVKTMPSEYHPGNFGFYAAKYIDGTIMVDPREVEDYGWYAPQEAQKLDLMKATNEFYRDF
jgi:mutator protein MutT